MRESPNCCLRTTCTLGTGSHSIELHQTSVPRFLTHLKVTAFDYILIDVVKIILLPLLIVVLRLHDFGRVRLALAQVLPRTLDGVLGSPCATILSRVV